MRVAVVTLASWIAMLACAFADQNPVRMPRVARPPVLDDYVSGEPPQGELVMKDFRQREPNDGDAASEQTTAYLSYDANNLYVAFVCRDRTPARLRARLSRRDAIAQDDQVVLMLDTFHDRQRAYVFAANPLGVQADAMASEGRDDDYSFDAVWRADGRLLQDGFAVLMSIPFRSLRVAAVPSGAWGLAVARVIPRNSEQSFWPYVTRRVEGLIQQFGTLESPQRVATGRNLQFIPYASASSGRYLDNKRSTFSSDTQGRLGLDAKVVIRDAVAVDVAINPDFSQVESDQPQVAVNQRFELFYPEKRPFFLESASTFRYVRTAPTDPTTRNIPDMLFFSRRLQNPELGARVTGKIGRWSFGGVLANDRGFSTATSAARDAEIAVARVQREFARQSTIGAFVTLRRSGGETNRVGAIDLRWKLSANWLFSGQAVTSQTRSAALPRIDGAAYNASLFYSSRRVLYSLFYSDRSPAFRTTLGFVPRVDIRQIEQYGEYRWRPTAGPIVAFGPNTYVRFNWNRAGQLQEWIVRIPFEVHLKGRTQIFVRRVESAELFRGVQLRQHIQTVNVTTEWLKRLSISEGFEWGLTPNYFPAAGHLPYVAKSIGGSLGLIFRPTPRLRYEQTYLHSGLAAAFSNNILRSTLNYQFTRRLSARAIADYNGVVPNQALVTLNRDKRVGVDTLLTYQVGPATALYLGYTTGFQNFALSEAGLPVERVEAPRTETGRQLFMKISYLIRR
jgi:hypothetical protein